MYSIENVWLSRECREEQGLSQRKRNATKTQTAILEAARRLFAQQDISAVSIRDIAQAAGVSHGLFQQYYGSREHMVAVGLKPEDYEASLDEIAGFSVKPIARAIGTEVDVTNRASAAKAKKA